MTSMRWVVIIVVIAGCGGAPPPEPEIAREEPAPEPEPAPTEDEPRLVRLDFEEDVIQPARRRPDVEVAPLLDRARRRANAAARATIDRVRTAWELYERGEFGPAMYAVSGIQAEQA